VSSIFRKRIDSMTKKQLIGSYGHHVKCCNDCDRIDGGYENPCIAECIAELNYKKSLIFLRKG
jgi:hypothetical protein